MGNRSFFALAGAAWLVFAILAVWLTRGGLSLDTDSAMRLVQVRDLLAGQGWFDPIQHRMNTPYGLGMHWSRLVDAPLAVLALVSERFALIAWPLLCFGAVLLLLARIAAAMGGRAAMVTVLLLALLCTELYGAFTPGNIDHHGLQLALMLAALLGLVEQRPILLAAAVSVSLGVGLESLPYVLAAIAGGAFWLKDDPARACRFGLALAGMAAALLLTVSAYRASPLCDSYSLFHAALLLTGGTGIAAISYLARHRLAVFLALAAGMVALAALLNPVCFAGPYAGMDERIKLLFLSRINEARPIWEFVSFAPSQAVGGYVYAVFTMILCAFAPAGRARNCVIVFAAIALLVGTFQIRGVNFAILFALPGAAAALVHHLLPRSIVLLAAAVLAGNSGAFTLAGVMLEGPENVEQRVAAFHRQEACGSQAAMALLQAQAQGRVAAFVDQGPAVLAYTHHAVVAGPYHRGQAGILDSYALFTGAQPQAVLNRRGIDYVLTCRAAPDWDFYRQRGGLIAQLAAGQGPDWLTRIGKTGDVELYRFNR